MKLGMDTGTRGGQCSDRGHSMENIYRDAYENYIMTRDSREEKRQNSFKSSRPLAATENGMQSEKEYFHILLGELRILTRCDCGLDSMMTLVSFIQLLSCCGFFCLLFRLNAKRACETQKTQNQNQYILLITVHILNLIKAN